MTRAFVGVGANLGHRQATIERAIDLLRAQLDVVAISTLRETAPWGYTDQPPFLNGALEVQTELSARALLDVLLGVEQELGRVREGGPRYGPRTIDLDLLVFGEELVDEPGLAVPHPRLPERAFALEPLAELDPALVIPGHGRVSDLLAALH